MCTLTVIPKGNKDFIITQNRDESPDRKSLLPNIYIGANTKMLFPKDVLSGGTWIGVSEKKRVVCMLNGAFQNHKRKPNYRKSRGMVTYEFMVSNDVLKMIDDYNFDGIEPFTMVVVDWNDGLKLLELVWDEKNSQVSELPLEPRMWSSSTLYTDAMKAERQQWFNTFKAQHSLNAKTLLHFHKTAGETNDDYGVIMNRGFVKTTSITQVEKVANKIQMSYEYLGTNKVDLKTFKFPQVVNG
ncbi:NRDE family protein [Tamlana fucoidanivorans]|uniref:NRDE family protein n=1 Tax=Allotamlana fucoidanivorans TaxID=2583814 RepID=A0A5C4SKW8_9FLAO|nr:NRDE family protein [Tamlana fucoidanivorans]TNJ44647.1 NRDE family protein [Tamlana fucoidanivorans]